MESLAEQLGLLGIFIAGAIPWFEAIVVVPSGILFGLDPLSVVLAAVAGNALTIVTFAYAGAGIRRWVDRWRTARGQKVGSRRYERAQNAFNRWGIFGLSALGPILIGTQFSAAVAVAAGVSPLRTFVIISAGMALWAIAIAVFMMAFGLESVVELGVPNG